MALIVAGAHLLGRFRLPRTLPARPASRPAAADAPVVALIPVHNEEATVADVVRGLPPTVCGRRVIALVVSTTAPATARQQCARAAGAAVVASRRTWASVPPYSRGLAEASASPPLPSSTSTPTSSTTRGHELPLLAAPVLAGSADYVVGSRFTGRIRRMLPHRRVGNLASHPVWVRWLTRQHDHRRSEWLPCLLRACCCRRRDHPRLQLRAGADTGPAGKGFATGKCRSAMPSGRPGHPSCGSAAICAGSFPPYTGS